MKALILCFLVAIINCNAWKGYDWKTEEKLEINLKTYMNNYPSQIRYSYSICSIYIFNNYSTTFADIANHFLMNNSNCSHFIFNAKTMKFSGKVDHYKYSQSDFIFLESISEIPFFVEQSLNTHLWNPNGDTHILISASNGDAQFLDYLKFMWKKGIYNYVIVLLYDNLKVIKYNPFINEVIDITNCKTCLYLNDVIKNMSGYKLRICIFEHEPYLKKINNTWVGEGMDVIKDIVKGLNATSEFIENEKKFTKAIHVLNFGSDVCLSPIFRFALQFGEKNLSIDYIYDKVNKLVVVLPKGKPKIVIAKVFLIFDLTTWLILIFLLFLFSGCFKLLSKFYKEKKTFTLWCLQAVQIFFQHPITKIHHYKKYLTLSLSAWILFTLIINIVVQTNLFSTFIRKEYPNGINTIQEIKDKRIVLIGKKVHVTQVSSKFPNNQLIIQNVSEIFKRLLAHDTSVGYILEHELAIVFTNHIKDDDYSSIFHIVTESIGHGFNVFMVQKLSPYLNSVERIINLRKEFSVSKIKVIELKNKDEQKEIICLDDLYGTFLLLLGGQALAFMVFIFELYGNKIKTYILKRGSRKYSRCIHEKFHGRQETPTSLVLIP